MNKTLNKIIKKTRRGKRSNMKTYMKSLVAVGVNPAGARSKWSTWMKVIRETGASLWFMQETKCPTKQLKMENYVVYEKVREKSKGGGVAIAAIKDLNPVLVSEGIGEVEAITIEVHPKKITIVCTSSYGPQKQADSEIKQQFWTYHDQVADNAWNEGKGFLLQGDLNARLGPNIIKNDPNPQNENGKLFMQFLSRHPQLTVLNSLPICKGLITRTRTLCTGKVERSVLDFFVVCSRVLSHITQMIVDEEMKYAVTNFSQVAKGGKAVD